MLVLTQRVEGEMIDNYFLFLSIGGDGTLKTHTTLPSK